MNFLQTCRFPKTSDPFHDRFGWLAPEFHIMSWALSCLQLKSLHENAILYASSDAAKLLIDSLGLPYDEVLVTHDNIYMPNEKLWALSKVHTYSLQESPFVHLDGDVYLFEALPANLLSATLIAQNIEEATGYYTSTQKELMKWLTFLPECVSNDFYAETPISAVNAGILGGTNNNFFAEYTDMAFNYIRRNEGHLCKFDADKFNVFFEQHLFYSMATERGLPITLLINERVKDNQYKDLASFHTTLYKKNYLHLLGHYKRDKYTCTQLAAMLRALYPDYYYKIISLCRKKNVPLFISFYNVLTPMENVNHPLLQEKVTAKYNEGLRRGTATSNLGQFNLNEIPELIYLSQLVDEFSESDIYSFNKQTLQDDLHMFLDKLSQIVANNKFIPAEYLYGRDLNSIQWFSCLFKDDSAIFEQVVEKCGDVSIFSSSFDWAGFARSYMSEGRAYYAQMNIEEAVFYNLVVPELNQNGFELFDIDETEKLILDNLSTPQSIQKLLISLQAYIEEDVLKYHFDAFTSLFIFQIQQLVLKKAIRPFTKATKISPNIEIPFLSPA